MVELLKNKIENKTAIQFFKEIENEQDKYKLVNGLFIVKYLNEDISVYIGEFFKGKKSIIKVYPNSPFQFNKNKGLCRRIDMDMEIWKPLNIKFIEKPIKEILK